MVRTAAGWAVLASAVAWFAMWWSDRAGNGQVWLIWTCVVIAGQLTALAYAATGITQRLGSQNYGRSGFVTGWLLSLVLSSVLLLLPALYFDATADLTPPGTLAHLVTAVLFPGLLMMVCLSALTRLWHLPKAAGAAVSIVLVLSALTVVMAVPIYYYGLPWAGFPAPGTPWVGTVLLVGAVVLVPLCVLAVRAVPIQNIHEVEELW